MALCSMLFADRIRFTQDDELPRGRLCLDVILTLVPAPVGRKVEYFDDRLHNTNQFLGPSNTISIMMIWDISLSVTQNQSIPRTK
jgi:hypothetical protein